MSGQASTVTLRGRADFTLANFAAVSRAGAAVRIDPGACARMAARRADFRRFIDAKPTPWVYGVTGRISGQSAVTLTREERIANAHRDIAAGAVLFGESAPERIVRGAVFCRLANFIEGHAAVRAEVALAVAALLDGPLPPLPRLGHGAAGETSFLSHLFGGLVERMALEEKEASALINGAPVAAALLADSLLSSGPLWLAAIEAAAVAIASYQAPLDACDPALGALWQSPHAARAAALLAAAARPRMGASPPRLPQAPVSFRAAPRLLGRALRSHAALRGAVERSLGAVTDNPLIVGDGGSLSALSNGGFFDADAPAALDELAAIAADLARLLEKLMTRCAEVADAGALPRPAQARLRGLLSALTGYAEDAAATASRTPLPASDGTDPHNDLISPVAQAWGKAAAASGLLAGSIAGVHAVDACLRDDPVLDVPDFDRNLRARMASVTTIPDELEGLAC